MATLVLQAAGQAVGGFLGPVGAIVGRAAGALAGHIVDQRLFGDNSTRQVGRLDEMTVQTASEGNALPKVYGRMRLAGTVVWATDFEEHVNTSSSGKGGGPQVEEFHYTASFAVAICEGPVARIGRVWADGEPLDLTQITMRTHLGEADQEPDDLIEAIEGVAPAFRGTAYVVFEHLPVGPFGNRIPQITFEIIRPVGELEKHVRAVTLIPGATEFGYSPQEVKLVLAPGEAGTENRHVGVAPSDLDASLDELQALCPNLERIALVVAWFGDDLRAGSCTIQPSVEALVRATDTPWSVGGLDRASARLVSADGEGRPNYGGTPSDNAVFQAIQSIKARGLKVVFYPFILMDIPAGNGLADPYGASEQVPFPWRGRITVAPAPGQAGSPDGTAAADSSIASLVGDAMPGDFAAAGDVVVYGGPAEWSLRRMMLHYAHLCAQAGGVDAFLVGSELRGLTTVRGASGYPFVAGLSALVDDVRSVVGAGTKISYAADWSEYFGHQPGDGTVNFHLDPVWANPNVDFIGIDNYWPLSDWRDGTHDDLALASSPHERAYLTGNVSGGEGYDWYYASEADRLTQTRTPITDGLGKEWVFRYKDLQNWWSNPHFDRVGETEAAQPTDWVPQSKPVWFTEVGCPAVDRGANQPNVFFDPKSSESKLPYFSSGRRDDEMQRAYLEAMLGAFDPALSSAIDTFNPVSGVYGQRMIDPGTVHVWTWDARPWPAFPHRTDVWSDGDNWERGHWLTGRLGGVPFADLVRALFRDWGLPEPQVSPVAAVLDGFLVSQPQSLRNVLDPLTAATSVIGADTGTGIRFVGPNRAPSELVSEDDLAELGAETPLIAETRDELAALPVEQRLRYFDSGREFQVASARYRPPEGSTRQIEEIAISASLNDGLATELAEIALNARWGGRTAVTFALPLSEIDVMPGDVILFRADGRDRELVVEEIEDLGHREVVARTLNRQALTPTPTPGSPTPPIAPIPLSPPFAFALNLPLLGESFAATDAFIAAYSRPWPGEMAIWAQAGDGSFERIRVLGKPSSVGLVAAPPPPDAPTSRWDYGAAIDVVMLSGTLQSRSDLSVLDGRNLLAVEAADGSWEMIQFRNATLIGERTYRLTQLLRGQVGTEHATAAGILPGARVAYFDQTIPKLSVTNAQIGYERTFRVGPASEGVGGVNTTTFDFTPTGRAKLPLAPVHGKARLRGDSGLDITWIRRTRIGGDAWPDSGDVPLGETAERYRIEILDGASTVRSSEVTSPLFVYSLAAQTADFGGAIDTVSMRVAQIAPDFGPGIPYEVTVDVEQP